MDGTIGMSIWSTHGPELVALFGVLCTTVGTSWRLQRWINVSLRESRTEMRTQMADVGDHVHSLKQEVIAMSGAVDTRFAEVRGELKLLSTQVANTNGHVHDHDAELHEMRNMMANAIQVHARVLEGLTAELREGRRA